MMPGMRTLFGLAAVFLGIAVLAVVTGPVERPDETVPEMASPGYRVAIDPATGSFVEPTEPIVSAPVDPMNFSTEGLVEVDNPIGGGTSVNLQGRFRLGYVATTDAEGNLVIECQPVASEVEGGERQ
jgi:hypothetical protein